MEKTGSQNIHSMSQYFFQLLLCTHINTYVFTCRGKSLKEFTMKLLLSLLWVVGLGVPMQSSSQSCGWAQPVSNPNSVSCAVIEVHSGCFGTEILLSICSQPYPLLSPRKALLIQLYTWELKTQKSLRVLYLSNQWTFSNLMYLILQ